MENIKLIYDVNEIDKFINILPKLENDEAWFIALFARNKYLTEEEKPLFGANGKANTLRKIIVRETEDIIKKLYSFEANSLSYISLKNNLPFPNKCLIPYFTFNPISTINAYAEMSYEYTKLLQELARSSDKKAVYHKLKKIDNILLEKAQHSFSRKFFIDIDFDLPDKTWKEFYWFLEVLKEKKATYHVIDTAGGYHALIETKTINWNYNKDLDILREKALLSFRNDKHEIAVNQNQAIPIPGCYQYGTHEVKLIESFIGELKK